MLGIVSRRKEYKEEEPTKGRQRTVRKLQEECAVTEAKEEKGSRKKM